MGLGFLLSTRTPLLLLALMFLLLSLGYWTRAAPLLRPRLWAEYRRASALGTLVAAAIAALVAVLAPPFVAFAGGVDGLITFELVCLGLITLLLAIGLIRVRRHDPSG